MPAGLPGTFGSGGTAADGCLGPSQYCIRPKNLAPSEGELREDPGGLTCFRKSIQNLI